MWIFQDSHVREMGDNVIIYRTNLSSFEEG